MLEEVTINDRLCSKADLLFLLEWGTLVPVKQTAEVS